MDRLEIEAKIKDIVASELHLRVEVIKNAHDIKEDLGADSLDRIEIGISIEEEFGIEILDEESEELSTVQEIIDFISDRTIDPPKY